MGQDWLEDPSNQDSQYLRSRVRQGVATLESMGLNSKAMADAAAALRRADVALEQVTDNFMTHFVKNNQSGVFISKHLLEQPDEIAQRTLEKVILQLNPAPLAPRVSKRLRLVHAFRQGEEYATLGGVKFVNTQDGIQCQLQSV